MAWCILSSCHKVVRSKRNTTLKLCGDRAKQFIRNAQNCGKNNHGFCTMITHQLTQRCLWVFGQKQNRKCWASTNVFTGLGPREPFPLLKTEDTDERKALCYDWGDKRKIETGAIGDTKKHLSRFEKNPGISVLYLKGFTLEVAVV